MAAGFKTAQVNASDVPSTQTNFPSYVDLSRLGITTLAEAQSVRVYADSAKTTEWAREIVSATEMHVKVPSLTSTVSMYVDYDGVRADYAVTDTYGRNAVWSDYSLVTHMEQSSGNEVDATGAHTITDTNTVTSAAGKLNGSARSFARASSEYFSVTSAASLQMGANNMTISAWIYPVSQSGSAVYNLCAKGWDNATVSNREYTINRFTGSSPTPNRIEVYDTGFKAATRAVNLSNDTWHFFVGRRDGTSLTFRENTTWSSSTTVGTLKAGDRPLHIGAQDTPASFWNGRIDEFRLRQSALSNDWITTEYNNQSDEAGFWGTWTDAGGPTASRGAILLDW